MAAVTPDDGAVVVPLLAMETSSMFMMAKGITAITFYRGLGRDDALAALRPKALALLAANPWLAGRLVRDAASKTPGTELGAGRTGAGVCARSTLL